MPHEPRINVLPYAKRQRFFWLLAFIFVVSLPLLIFYTTGYRLTFVEDEPMIVTTGGLYVSTFDRDAEVFVNGERAVNPRLFRSAYYIQNIAAGQHQVVVQHAGYHTWVKSLPVDAYLVTEAASFNVPIVPHVRPITPLVSSTGTPVVLLTKGDADPFLRASSTVAYRLATTSATSSLVRNSEYDVMVQLFATTTATSTSVFQQVLDHIDRFRFSSATSTATTTATSTPDVLAPRAGDLELRIRSNDIYAVWTGLPSRVPYYFCVSSSSSSTVAARYGTHVADAILMLRNATTTGILPASGTNLCRPEIKLNRLRQDVYFYEFFPNVSDLVLLQLEDGLYVTEIDDRAWQNTQLLYPGSDFQVAVSGGRIYLREAGHIFEVLTTVAEPQ